MSDGYSVNMRQDKRTGEHLAVIPNAYQNHHGERYYMALTLLDGWVELSPAYVTRCTRTVAAYDEQLKRAIDRAQGYILNIATRLSAS